MSFNDLREWIDDLEERKDLTRVQAEVDWDEEIGAITRAAHTRANRCGQPALTGRAHHALMRRCWITTAR